MPNRAIPFAQITVDDARVDGIQGAFDDPTWSLAMGRVFSFPMRRYRDLKEHEIGPAWYLGRGMEYVPQLRAIGPRGYVAYENMNSAHWTVISGDVRLVRWAGNGRKQSAFFPQGGGVIRQHADYLASANECFEIMLQRWRPPDGTTTDCDVYVSWLATSGTQWSLRLPFPEPGTVPTAGLLDPALWWSLDSGANWYEGKSFKGMRLKSGRGASEEPDVIRWEPFDGLFLLTVNDEQYFVTCDLDLNGRKWPVGTGAGPVEVQVIGHQALVHVQGIKYPDDVTAEVAGYWNAGTSAYGGVYVDPRYAWPAADAFGWQLVVTKAWPTGATTDITVDVQPSATPRTIRPKLTFHNTGANMRRAVCYLAEVYAPPAFVVPGDLATQWDSETWSAANGGASIERISGHMTDAWKGNTFEADLICDEGQETALTAWQGGQKVQATVGWRSTDAADDSCTAFVGYMRDGYPEINKNPHQPNRVRVKLSVEDGYAKLADQRCKDCGPFAGWAFVDAFEFLCLMGGIPPALIDHTDIVPGDLPNLGILPCRGADPLFEFGSDRSIPVALDVICTEMSRGALQVQWTFALNGKVCARLKPTYAAPGGGDWTLPGYWTLDDEAVPQHDQLQDVTVHQSVRERGNWIAVVAGRAGTETYRVLADLGSIFDPTKPNFIGQIKPEFVHLPDADDDPTAIDELVLKILGDRTERHREITWPTRFHTTVAPDTWVRVQTSHLNVTTNAVFRVTDKSYWAEHSEERSTARETITARQVYYWNGTYYEEVIAA